MSLNRVFLAVFLTFWAGLSVPALAEAVSDDTAAGVPTEVEGSPMATISGFNGALEELIGLPEDADFTTRLDIMKSAVGTAFDMPVLARRTMSRTVWNGWSAEQKQTYVDTLQAYQASVLADRFKPGASVSFEVDGVEDGPRGTKLVKTRILRTGDEDVKLNYLTADRNGSWRVVDIYLNSTISEVAMRRSEYSAIVSERGFDGLIAALNAEIDEMLVANTPIAEEMAADSVPLDSTEPEADVPPAE